jgi:ABC-2 type transport system ATP-binding protein
MRLLTGLIRPSQGTLSVLGLDPLKDAALFRDLGFCSEDDALFDDMTPREMVSFLANCAGISRQSRKAKVDHALEITGIAYAADRKCQGFSKGMRQRTRMAAAIVHEPRLLLLDEPMTGLVPVGRRAVLDLVKNLAAEGCSIIFSSHILYEVEAIAEHVVLISRGMALAEGSLNHIKESMGDYRFTMSIQCDRPRDLGRELASRAHVQKMEFEEDGRILISTESSKTLLAELPQVILDLNLLVSEIDCPGENLDTLFQRLLS